MTIKIASLLTTASLTLLGACATAPEAGNAQVNEPKQVCTTESSTGSSIARRTCHAPMSDDERAAVDRDITLHSQPKINIKNN